MARLDLHTKLLSVVEGTDIQVWYSPNLPSNIRLKYPTIVYSDVPSNETQYANNKIYINYNKYEITFMSKVHNREIPIAIANAVNFGKIVREYESDNVYHTIISCYEIY